MNQPLTHSHNWRNVNRYLAGLSMELDQFMELHPDISREQLAEICGCTLPTVNNWFAEGSTHREPTGHHKLRLAIAHWLTQEPQVFQEIRKTMNG